MRFFFQNNQIPQTILLVSQGFKTILVSNKSSVENSSKKLHLEIECLTLEFHTQVSHTRIPSGISQSKIEFSALDLLDTKIVSKPWLTNKIVWLL